jgi:hypothetical protein
MAFLSNESGVIRAGGSARVILNARRRLHFLLILLSWFAFGLSVSTARAEVSREYELKAAFLFNFAQFTQWPTNAFAGPDKPLVIGILGLDPFGSALEDIVRGETIQGRRLVVERYRRVEEIQTCHILFISQSESSRLESHLKALQNRPILTVSDIEDSAFRGVMIRFVTQSNKIRLRINLDALEAAHITVSSKLLRAADVVPEIKRP